MIHFQCPSECDTTKIENSLFLGGGISSCPMWQPKMLELLKDTDLIVVNPRRENFDINDPSMTARQIEWEFKYLARVSAKLFWFPCETLCPITLFELGKACENPNPLFVGCHPDYKRKVDLEVQLRLARPSDCEISISLETLASRIKKWA